MSQHRFRELIQGPIGNRSISASSSLVPLELPASFTPSQLSFIREIYRLAAEQTRKQREITRRFLQPTFSRN